MEKTYFNIDEVNQLIPQLEYHFQKIFKSKSQMLKVSCILKKAQYQPVLMGDIPEHQPQAIRLLQQEVQLYYQAFKEHILAIEEMGGEIRDLELGRVDFYSLEAGREVLLTWALGLTEVPLKHEVEVMAQGA